MKPLPFQAFQSSRRWETASDPSPIHPPSIAASPAATVPPAHRHPHMKGPTPGPFTLFLRSAGVPPASIIQESGLTPMLTRIRTISQSESPKCNARGLTPFVAYNERWSESLTAGHGCSVWPARFC